MPALTTSKTTKTPATGPGANGRYRTKTERSLALMREDPDISISVFRRKFLARYGEELGDPTVFYRVRNQVKTEQFRDETEAIEAREESTPNVADRPAKTPLSPIIPLDAYDRIEYEPEPKPPYVLVRNPGQKTPLSSSSIAYRLPLLSFAAAVGGLLALRRAVDELIGGLAPELREGDLS